MSGEIIFTDKESVMRFVEAIFNDDCKTIVINNRTTRPPLVENYLVKYEQK